MDRNQKIIEMLTSGESVSYISKTLHCCKSIVQYYKTKIPNYKHSSVVRDRMRRNAQNAIPFATKRSAEIWSEKKKLVSDEAEREWNEIKKDPNLMGFLGLYWGEGQKDGCVGIANNDPGVIVAFARQVKIFSDKKITYRIAYCFDEEIEKRKLFWQAHLHEEVKMLRKKPGKKPPLSPYGCCYARLSDWKLQQKIKTWLSCWKNDILNIPTTP